ncbi:SDR family oxidoreductase [Massilia sp. NEAU-DD11]|uniref:SDR family oxidoreductase n=1 Tax=Massilia cellulosiltytica TaxID=2683234 RepID=A0A7X3K7V0_9BURK|nr:SDR family oxidoreductase [Telluria cellulosilytica]MVW60695.1 SDR family oxidoreductase [Telluria cellulosilytica]
MNARKDIDFAGKTAVVTGGASGIGESIARLFAAHGASVLVADRDADGAARVAASLPDGAAVVCDLALDDAPARIVAAARERFGGVDIVVHNAAYFPLTDFTRIDRALLERTFAVNVHAAFGLLQAALPIMRARGGGRMLVTSSVTGPRVAYPGLAHYAASKAAVNGFIRAAALEVAADGVTVNGVEPGMIRTPAQDNLGGADVAARLRARIPLGRLGEPDDIAAAMLFLASDHAAYVTGQTIIVDGGALLPEG